MCLDGGQPRQLFKKNNPENNNVRWSAPTTVCFFFKTTCLYVCHRLECFLFKPSSIQKYVGKIHHDGSLSTFVRSLGINFAKHYPSWSMSNVSLFPIENVVICGKLVLHQAVAKLVGDKHNKFRVERLWQQQTRCCAQSICSIKLLPSSLVTKTQQNNGRKNTHLHHYCATMICCLPQRQLTYLLLLFIQPCCWFFAVTK